MHKSNDNKYLTSIIAQLKSLLSKKKKKKKSGEKKRKRKTKNEQINMFVVRLPCMHHKPINPARNQGVGRKREEGREGMMGIQRQREFNNGRTWGGRRGDANMDDG